MEKSPVMFSSKNFISLRNCDWRKTWTYLMTCGWVNDQDTFILEAHLLFKRLLQNGCEDLDDHCVVGGALQDDALMFCNPEASSALDQDSSAEFPNPSISDSVQSSHAQTSIPRIGGSSADQLPEEPRHSTCTEPSGESMHLRWYKNTVILFKCKTADFYVNICYNVIYFCDAALYFQHHYSSRQCHMIFRNHSNIMI